LEGEVRRTVSEATRGVIRGLGFEQVDVDTHREGRRLFVTILIDREGGVTLEDCASASDLIGEVLEREDVVGEPYVLEVMSPGVNRPLGTLEEFKASIGKRVKVELYGPFEGKREYSGVLMDAEKDSFTLETGKELLNLKYESISKARLDPELPW